MPSCSNGPFTSPAPIALKGCSGSGGGGGGGGGFFFVAVRHVSGQFGHAHFPPHGVAEWFEHSPGVAVRAPVPLQMAHEGGHGFRLAVAHELQPLPHTRVEQHGGAAAACPTATIASSIAKAVGVRALPFGAAVCTLGGAAAGSCRLRRDGRIWRKRASAGDVVAVPWVGMPAVC